jgi:hypothetical protein
MIVFFYTVSRLNVSGKVGMLVKSRMLPLQLPERLSRRVPR